MRNLHLLTYALIIIGAFFGFDLVAAMFGNMTTFTRIVYSLIGLSAVAEIIYSTQHAKTARDYAH